MVGLMMPCATVRHVKALLAEAVRPVAVGCKQTLLLLFTGWAQLTKNTTQMLALPLEILKNANAIWAAYQRCWTCTSCVVSVPKCKISC